MAWTNLMMGAAFLGMALAMVERTFTFSKDDVGQIPAGWTADKTGTGDGSIWKVVDDATAPSKNGYVLAQTAAGPTALFNLCIAEDTKFKDIEATVSFKAARGKIDQGGGIVWRYHDHDNYYIARFNPLENNYRVYKVVHGKRTQLQTKEDLKVPAGQWHSLKITMKGDHIQCFLDGTKHLDVRDTTFPYPGKVGLWTKADAQTYFDELRVAGD